jgi:hypothetical protein
MSVLATSLHWMALALAVAALFVGVGALLARSLFAMCMYVAGAGALAASALVALGAGDAALAVALSGAAWAPLLLLAAMLLSSRAAKPMRRGAPWFSLIAGIAAAAAVMFVVPDIGAAAVRRDGGESALGPWLAPLLLAAAAACVGMLGYGERGALQRHEELEP